MKTPFVGLLLSGFALIGCVTTETHYKSINGMAYCENCKAIIVTTSESEKIKLPSGGYAGASIDLGSIEKEQTRGEVSRVLGLINQSIVTACEGQKASAFANDRANYDKWAAIQQNQITKLDQLENLIAQGESAPASAAANPTPTAAAIAPAAVAEASPTPAAAPKRDARLKKWASVYSPKNRGKVRLPKSKTVAPTAAAPTPPVVTPAVQAVLETQPKSPQALGLPAK